MPPSQQPLQPGQPGQPALPQQPYPAATQQQPANQPSAAQPPQPQGNGIQVVAPPIAPHQSTYRPPQLQPLSGQPKPADTPAQPSTNGSPYDFFLEPKQQTKKPGLIGAGGQMSGFTKILIGAGALFAVMGLLAVGLSLSRGNQSNGPTGLNAIAQSQQEIIRVAELGEKDIVSQDLANFTATAIGALTSEQQRLIDFGAKNGNPVDSKQLELSADTKTDAALAAAKSASTYDATYRSTMKQLLTTYQTRTQTAYNASTTASARDILDKNLTSAKLLLQMLGVNDLAGTTPTS